LLSEIVLQKTDGIVIHIIEFFGRLTMDRILCHSFVKGWEWDSEEIEGYPISDSVAELFVFKLNKLPPNALRALQICSIFGSQIEPRIINFVQDFDGDQTVDITVGLKVAEELGLVEMIGTANVFKFAHDIIAEVRFSC
jgi:ATP-dependent RNA helicase DDX31/DBP7